MDNIDTILEQAGITPSTTPRVSRTSRKPATPNPVEDPPQHEEEVAVPLSDTEFDNLLQDFGFQESTEEDGEMEEAINEMAVDEDSLDPTDDGWDDEVWSERAEAQHEALFNPESVADEEFEVTTSEEQSVPETPDSPEEPSPSQPQDDTILPTNSATFSIEEATSRFSGAEWFNEIQKARIIVAGLGGIGSWCAFQLARMKPASLCVYDDDVVEAVNMSGQFYGSDEFGLPKSDAIARIIQSYTHMDNLYAINEKFTEHSEAGDIMICGFDNMDARRTFFNAWQAHVWKKPEEERSKCLFLDGRLSMDTFQVLCITGDDTFNMERYRDEFLFRGAEADPTVCSMKQTTYLACMIGSYMVNMFTNFIANLIDPIIPYSLPFFTEYDAEHVIFKIEN